MDTEALGDFKAGGQLGDWGCTWAFTLLVSPYALDWVFFIIG